MIVGALALSASLIVTQVNAGSHPSGGEVAQSRPAEHTIDWKGDIDTLVAELPKRHKNAFFKTTRRDFEQAAAALKEKLPTLTNADIVIGMARLVAMLGDGHTMLSVSLNDWHLRRFPLGIG